MIPQLEDLLHARQGPMTSELVLRPGDFGLGRIPARLKPAATTDMVCGFCSTGCSLRVHLNERGQAINLTTNPHYSVNQGMACPKGWEALTPLSAPDRVTTPLLRNPATGNLEPVDWPTALAAFVKNFKGIQERHGKTSLSFLSTGQIVMEEMALLGALAKFGMGMTDVDSNTRQCMATSHVAYKQSFGFDAPPFTYKDFEESDALIFIGANPCIAHPIMWQRVMMNKHNPDIVVIDPRRTETAMAATLHVPLLPKSDLVLLYGLANLLIERGAIKQDFIDAHTSSFADFASFLREFTLDRTARETGLPAETLHRLVDIIATRERVSLWWTMGVNQGHESTRTAQAIINLALMTGNIGRPGTGANSITGQCNAMGSRLFGNASSLLGGYDFAKAEHRSHVASILGIDPALIPDRASLAYDQILDGIDKGSIRGLWVIATNTAHSWINQKTFPAIREKLEFLVVQDMYATTETARMADLVLPAAGWGEKDGILINSERRLGIVKKVSRAPGQALSDFAIFKLVADAWGCGHLFAKWSSPEAAFQILKELSRRQPCEFTGISSYEHIDRSGGIQWPFTDKDAIAPTPIHERTSTAHPERERRLFSDGQFFTPDRRAKFLFDQPRPMPELPDADYPMILLTGRGSSAQWHTGSRTDKSDVLRKLAPRELYVEINPIDADRLRIANNELVRVRSRRGEADALALITSTVQPGQIYLPMHFDTVNRLTFPAFDPHSRQPSYKACAVRVERIKKR
ncbi:nitrate reductase [Nibricoccus aquaticus]|uniref:Nitrate reductase n=1 Tax=Nibricoccus aquaticus TaxID=2576891 RepID=A0A290Q2B7_9BACT|nr:molybdopterin oxidoreductase family protein [Nibricoccus aquaticus]ATC62563.1 nitrate reductase [Nibricoccus aquaticus]